MQRSPGPAQRLLATPRHEPSSARPDSRTRCAAYQHRRDACRHQRRTFLHRTGRARSPAVRLSAQPDRVLATAAALTRTSAMCTRRMTRDDPHHRCSDLHHRVGHRIHRIQFIRTQLGSAAPPGDRAAALRTMTRSGTNDEPVCASRSPGDAHRHQPARWRTCRAWFLHAPAIILTGGCMRTTQGTMLQSLRAVEGFLDGHADQLAGIVQTGRSTQAGSLRVG